MSYEINLRFRRFCSGTGQLIGLSVSYIGFLDPKAPGGSAIQRAHCLAYMGKIPKPATISPCNIAMDRNAIICFMTDGLTRGPDADVHDPSVGSPKCPSRRVDVIYS